MTSVNSLRHLRQDHRHSKLCRCHQQQHQYQHQQQQHRHHHQQHQHSSRLRPVLLPRSPAALVTILIFSSVWTLPPCRALDTLLTNSASTSGHSRSSALAATSSGGGAHTKRTILPFHHFKLLQDYLQKYGAGGADGGAGSGSKMSWKPHFRHPPEMLFPPGAQNLGASHHNAPWWRRSRRSVPLENIANSLSSKAYLDQYPWPVVVGNLPAVSAFSQSPSPNSQDQRGKSVVEDLNTARAIDSMFNQNYHTDDDMAAVKFSSQLPRKSPAVKQLALTASRYLLKLQQKQEIKEALRRKSKARSKAAAARRARLRASSAAPPTGIPSALAKVAAAANVLRELETLRSDKPFVRKSKSQKDRAAAAMLNSVAANDRRNDGFGDDPFRMFPSADNNVRGVIFDGFTDQSVNPPEEPLHGEQKLNPDAGFGDVEWLVSPSQSFSSLPASTSGGGFSDSSSSFLPRDNFRAEPKNPVGFSDGFGDVSDFSDLNFASTGHFDDGFASPPSSSSAGFEGFGPAVAFPGNSGIVTSSFGSGGDAGFGNFFDDGGFSTNDNDCADIETKSCVSNLDCSCQGLYTCSSEGRCQIHRDQRPLKSQIWHEGPVDFGLSKRQAAQTGNLKRVPETELPAAEVDKAASRRR